MDSKGNDIVGEELGLLLYKGGTVCDDNFNYNAADAICREMNFKFAINWTTEESFEIQNNYEIILGKVNCSGEKWDSCRFSEEHECGHSKDVFLSCTSEGNSEHVERGLIKDETFTLTCVFEIEICLRRLKCLTKSRSAD